MIYRILFLRYVPFNSFNFTSPNNPDYAWIKVRSTDRRNN